jgi:glycosyltransferase involved in cell wall biosynthesis
VSHKGIDNLLAAFAEATKRLNAPKLFLTLVGPDWGGSKTWLEDRAEKLGIGDRVTFTGSLSGEAVAKEFHTHDIYIQLSRYEGFSLSIGEALLAKKICILSHATGIASIPNLELYQHIRLVTGEVEDTASTVVDVCRRLPELRRAAEEAHEPLIRFFSWKRIAKLHLETYAKLLGATPARDRCGYVQ